jgi:hypothetical protein
MEVDMKNNKLIRVTLTILLTVLVLAGVAGAGFRMGVMQSANLTKSADGITQPFPVFGHMRGFDNQPGGYPGMMQGFDQRGGPGMMQGFEHGGFDRGGRGGHGGFFPPIFGLIKLAVLGLLLWLGFKFVKNSGWRLTRTAPAASETPSVEVEEKKETE